ncbi:MAG TPA: hypothetical protein VN726_19280 [Hanamia sp.]|nr:hypothetical protein [Hanamia sp.]
MKTTSVNLLTSLIQSEIENLTNEVKETICVDYKRSHKKLSAANLWNIERRRRSTNARKFYQW